MARTRLSNMRYDEVSFVPSGANNDDTEGAHILIAKNDDGDEGKTSLSSRLSKALSGFFGEVADIEKDAAVLEADAVDTVDEVDEVEDDLDDDDTELSTQELIDLINEADDIDPEGGDDEDGDDDPAQETLFVITDDDSDATAPDDETSQEANMPNIGKIEKSALPADVQQYIGELEKAAGIDQETDIFKGMSPEATALLQSQQATIEKMLEDQEMGEARTIAKSFTFLPVNHEDDTTAKALRSLSKADPEAFAEVDRILKAANSAMQTSEVFKEFGTAATEDASGGTPESKVEKRADEIVKSDPTISKAEAKAQAWRDHFAAEEKVGA